MAEKYNLGYGEAGGPDFPQNTNVNVNSVVNIRVIDLGLESNLNGKEKRKEKAEVS